MSCPQYGQLLNLGAEAGACGAGGVWGCAGAGAAWPCCICIWGEGLPHPLQNL